MYLKKLQMIAMENLLFLFISIVADTFVAFVDIGFKPVIAHAIQNPWNRLCHVANIGQ